MSTKNNKITATNALLEMDSIMKSIKEESKSTMKTLLSEAVKNALRESVDEDDEDYEVVDGENDENGTEGQAQEQQPTEPVEGEEAANGEEAEQTPAGEEANADGDWSEFDQYKVGDDTWDLTGVQDNDTVVKVYKLLKDTDQVVIKQENNKVQLQDNETGAEYVIDLGGEEGEAETDAQLTDDTATEGEEGQQELNESIYEIDLDGEDDEEFNDEEPSEDTDDYEFDLEDDDDDSFDLVNNEPIIDNTDENDYEAIQRKYEFGDREDDNLGDENEIYGFNSFRDDEYEDDDEPAGFSDEYEDEKADEEDFLRHDRFNQFESKKTKKTMKESKNNKEVIFEIDLGYTDNYQKEDPIEGLSNTEPSKSGKSWHKGVPTGTEKPWAGKTNGKGDPFDKTVNEEEEGIEEPVETVDEAATSKSRRDRRHTTKTNSKSTGDSNYNPQVTKVDNGKLNEAIKKLKNENKELQEAVIELRKSLQEACMTNINLGKITKLFVENTTTQDEKINIVNRFTNEAKTAEQSLALYESISKQLKANSPKVENITENKSGMTVNGSQVINENKVYKTKDLMSTIDLMNRVMSC